MSSASLIGSSPRMLFVALFAAVLLPACGSTEKGRSVSGVDGGGVDFGAADVRPNDGAAADIGGIDADAGAGTSDGRPLDITPADVAPRDAGADAAERVDNDVTTRDAPVDTRDAAGGADVLPDRAALPDLPPQLDSTLDAGSPLAEVAPDQPVDASVAPDLAPDVGEDATDVAGVTTLNVFGNCSPYTHTRIDSQGKPFTYGIRGVTFTPDGRYLMSFGQDSRAKVWKVTETGLEDAITGGLIFLGDRNLTGAISADGKRVLIGDQGNNLTLYDLESSLQLGASVALAEFPSTALTSDTDGVTLVQFTSDGKHIVAFYSGYMKPDPNHLLVWDIDTRTVVRDVTFDYDDVVRAVLPAAYTEPMWVASAKSIGLDGGGYGHVVSLVDVATPAPRNVVQLTTPDEVVEAAFWPDAGTLTLGLYNGEVGLWDINDKANIARRGSPIISASSSDSVLSLAFTHDRKYLAAGLGAFLGLGQVKLHSLDKKTTLHKTLDYLPWSLGLAPDGLALAIGGHTNGALIYCRP